MNARVQRIYQPSATEIVLHLHRYREQHCLLLLPPRLARLHLTGASFSNPQSPPPFCMLLRSTWWEQPGCHHRSAPGAGGCFQFNP